MQLISFGMFQFKVYATFENRSKVRDTKHIYLCSDKHFNHYIIHKQLYLGWRYEDWGICHHCREQFWSLEVGKDDYVLYICICIQPWESWRRERITMVIFMMWVAVLPCVVTGGDNTLLITARQIDLSSSSSLFCPNADTERDLFSGLKCQSPTGVIFLPSFHFLDIQVSTFISILSII